MLKLTLGENLELGGIVETAKLPGIEKPPTLKPNIQLFGEKAEDVAVKGADAINKAPYDPRAMEKLVKGGGEVVSSTIPAYNYPNVRLAGQCLERSVVINLETGETVLQRVVFDQKGFPIFDPYVKMETRITGDLSSMAKRAHMRAATRQLRVDIETGRISKGLFTPEEIIQIDAGKPKIGEYTWHHHQDGGRMQLIPTEIHKWIKHIGGNKLWGKQK